MESCRKPSHSFVLFDNVVLHVLILFVILTILFIFVISKLSYNEFNTEFNKQLDDILNPDIVKKIIDDFKGKELTPTITADGISYDLAVTKLAEDLGLNLNDPGVKQGLIDLLVYINNPALFNPDTTGDLFRKLSSNYSSNSHKLRESTDNSIYMQIAMIIGFMIFLAFIINFLSVKFGNCGILKHLGVELLAVFTLIALVEVWFFMNVGMKYIPVHVDVFIRTIQDQIKDKLK